jgi:hypothetical protein
VNSDETDPVPGTSLANREDAETNHDEAYSPVRATKSTARLRGERARGAPSGNRNAEKHGLSVAREALRRYGSRAIDRRTSVGRELARWRENLIADLGGKASLSTQEEAIVDLLVRDRILLDSVDTWLLSQTSLATRRRALIPGLEQRARLADSMGRRLQLLGLKRRTRRKSVQQVLAEIQREAESSNGSGDSNGNDAGDDEN